MTEEQKNEIQVWEPAPFEGTDLLPVSLGAQETDTTGRENIEAEDMILPTLKLLQGLSPEVTTGDHPDARAGLLFHSGIGEVIEPPIRALLCAHTRSRALFPNERDPAYAGLEQCLSRDGKRGDVYGECKKCPHAQWREKKQPPLCSEAHNFTVLSSLGIAVVRFARTSFRAARNFVTAWGTSPKPLWAHPVQIASRKASTEIGGKTINFHTLDLKWLQKEDVPPAAQAAAKDVHERVSAAHKQGRFAAEDEGERSSFDDQQLD